MSQTSIDEPDIPAMRDVSDAQVLQNRLSHAVLHDDLTGLPNRSFFSNHIRNLLDTSILPDQFALFFMDIDHFKHLNDNIGHAAGDALLQQIAMRLTTVCVQNFTARLGGDEYAIIFPYHDQREVSTFAQAVLAIFREPFQLAGQYQMVSSTIGIVLAPEHGRRADSLLRNADLALYAAKADGRGSFRFYHPTMCHQTDQTNVLMLELQDALDQQQLSLLYQPIITLDTGCTAGFEALLRWHHPQRGVITPDAFIPAAEETDLILKLGEWVLHRACQDAANWPDEVKIAVNLSSVQFNTPGLLETVKRALQATGLAANRLELEITETVFLSNTQHNTQLLHDLRDLGISIAMDDFGTGYSSLNYLRNFPFDKIKIDRSFVCNLEKDARNLPILQAVVALGSAFNMITTAEGVETAEQFALLKSQRFTQVQGFFTGKPMPLAQTLTFLAR